ncbi:hypothetical protein RUND412_006120 [Rhizina undulata]
MPDLRRRALGGANPGKTISRKAKSRQSSAASSVANSRENSRVNSRVTSRAASRANSDDEGNLSDETNISLGSMGELQPLDVPDHKKDWQEQLDDKITHITGRKVYERGDLEETYAGYIAILSSKYAKEEIFYRKDELLKQFLKSIKSPKSMNEGLLATKALVLTIVSDPTDDLFDKVYPTFRLVIEKIDSNFPLKAAIIHALGAATFYGGASSRETEEIMQFLQKIVNSDGGAARAHDDAGVVTAALEEWGFLCTQLDDAEDITKEAMPGFIEQLNSTEVSVQIAAGENIALLYEKSYTEAEEDELDDPNEAGKKYIQRYKPVDSSEEEALIKILTNLSRGSHRNLSKRTKKARHSAFNDILHSVENPLKGPKYSEALDKDNNVHGSRMKVRVHRNGVLRVDKWWKLLRLQHLRRALTGGFLAHWLDNPVVFESLR